MEQDPEQHPEQHPVRPAGGPELPRSPSGRVPRWVRDEAAARDVVPEPRRPAVRGPLRVLGRQLLLGASVVAALAWGALGGPVPPLPGAAPAPSPVGPDLPTPGRGAAGAPLGEPAPLAATSAAYRFLHPREGGATAYDPCRPVHYVVRPDGAPPGGDLLLAEAVARVGTATGLRFVAEGATAEGPVERRAPFQRDAYGDRWAPVLVAWATPAEAPRLAGEVTGYAGSHSVTAPGRPPVLVTGEVVLDAGQMARVLARPGGWAAARGIVQHELAHLVGLGHVDDPTQLMHPSTGPVTDFAAGDLTGLAVLGRGPCVPEV
ncbi:peptidase [Vallicoccus soli]|uniref:Peptidase n=1 Tax=Vallicoccus soli TaxID=2339232 RepID=A0A3A3YWX4_9ACTN|nr:peptidase [Vallicoccus soli]RJK94768.1 peptidase [Vallicoccus soli]